MNKSKHLLKKRYSYTFYLLSIILHGAPMNQSFNFEGIWHIPNKKSNKIHGSLNFDFAARKIELITIGTFYNGDSYDGKYIEFIVGTNTKGENITLYECTQYGFTEGSQEVNTNTFLVNVLFKGAILSSVDDLKFDSIRSSFSNLLEWLNVSGFSKNGPIIDTNTIKVEYNRPESIKFDLMKDLSGEFSFGYNFPFSHNLISIEQLAHLTLLPKSGIEFDVLIKHLFFFRNFLSLAQFENIAITSIDVTNDQIYRECGSARYPVKIEVFLFGSWTKQPIRKSIHQMLFSYQDIIANFTSIIEKWYEKQDLIFPPVAFLVDSVASDRTISENSFLNIIQAVETFHRRFRNNKVLPTTKYNEKKQNIIDSVDEQYKKWIEGRMHFGNEPSLHERLEELISEMNYETLNMIIKDTQQFIRDVKNSRNYYTHYDPPLKKKAKSGNALFQLTEKLKVLLAVAVLKEIGFMDEQIKSILKDKEWVLFNHLFD